MSVQVSAPIQAPELSASASGEKKDRFGIIYSCRMLPGKAGKYAAFFVCHISAYRFVLGFHVNKKALNFYRV